MTHESSAYTVQNVHKAFKIIDFLTESPDDSSLQALASKVQMTRNKTYRILATLCEDGLVEKNMPTGNYRLGFSSFSMAQKLIRNSNVISLAHPIIEQLAKKHGEAFYMAVIRGDEVLFLDMADCNQQIKAVSLIGKKFPYFTNAAGKVLKALESAEVIEWLTTRKYGRNKNIKDPELLASELRVIRSNGGMAVDTDGLGEGIISVAVAVKDYAGQVIGAITMLGPSFRFVKERIENEIIPSLREGAALASQKFGYVPAETQLAS